MRILAFGTYDTTRHPRVGVLIAGLRVAGCEVAEVDVPLGFSTAARVEMLQRPWRLWRLVARLARCWAMLAVRGLATRRRWMPDAVLVGYLGHFDVLLARLLFPRTRIVLDHLLFAADTARDRGEAGGLKQRLLTALDALALRAADVIVVDTPEHAALVPAPLAGRVVVCPVGAPDSWFAAEGPRDREPGPLRIVFFGLFTPLQGAPVIGAAAALAAREDIEWTMIGTGQDLSAARQAAAANPNITWLPWAPPDELPAIVAAHDVCLGIFGTGTKARNVVPNKVYQGAAAGTAIVTSDTRPQRAALGDAAVFVPPGDAPALARAVAELAADRSRLELLRAAAADRARSSFTATAVAGPLREALARPGQRADRRGFLDRAS